MSRKTPCREYRWKRVGDEPLGPDLEDHVARCPECSTLRKGDRSIEAAAERWRASSPEPSDDLERRIAAAIEREDAGAVPRASRRGPVWLWGAAAAALLLAAGLVFVRGNAPGGELETAMQQADAAERAYARAIASLEVEAVKVLDKAADPALVAEQAAILFSYRDRLGHLDAVIAEVRVFLDENPGHSGGHTVLLAAYKEKQEVLQEVLTLQFGDVS